MKQTFFIVLIVWLVGVAGCEPKPVSLKYLQYYCMVRNERGIGVVLEDRNLIANRLADKQLLSDTSTLWEFIYICGDGIQAVRENIDDLNKRINPDPALPLNKYAQPFLVSVDSVERLEQRIILLVKDGKTDSISELVARQQYFVMKGRIELRRLDSILAVYEGVHRITDKDVQEVMKR